MRGIFRGMSLFRKIFLSFLFTVLFASVLNIAAMAAVSRMGFLDLSLQDRVRRLIQTDGAGWVNLYEKEGHRELRRELRRLRLERGITVVILNMEGESILQGFPSERMMGRMMEMEGREHHGPVATEMVKSSNGTNYLITLFVAPGALPPRDNLNFFLGGYLFLFCLLGGIVSYLLAKHFARPMESLSQASRALSAGDLSVRTKDVGSFYDDEIGQLAKNFDSMAEHIENTITGQQRLLRDISHELRSPLTRMNLSLELLRLKTGGEGRALIERLERESDRMNSMIGDLLSLAREEGRFGNMKREPLSLMGLLERVVSDGSFEARAHDKDVVLSDFPEQTLSLDGGLVTSALENIVRNGIRYTETGTSVEVSAQVISDHLEISVADRGPGVSEENIDAIFSPFFREDSARDRVSGGVGLGLSIARRAIERHGGTIRAFNRKDGGLSVVVKIPI